MEYVECAEADEKSIFSFLRPLVLRLSFLNSKLPIFDESFSSLTSKTMSPSFEAYTFAGLPHVLEVIEMFWKKKKC